MALIDKLNNIGDAIRAKTGTSDKMTLDEMAAAIEGISVGGGDDNSGGSGGETIYPKYNGEYEVIE